jgi:hypothetical protein
MPFSKTIVCLANSRKMSKRCIAGKEIINNQLTHTWIRPVSSVHHAGELSEVETLLNDGKGPQLLDVLTIPFAHPDSHAYQIENYVIAKNRRWTKRPMMPISLLPSLCDSVPSLWINDYHSATGQNDRIPWDIVTANIHSSLLLIKPDNLTITVSPDAYRIHKKIRAHFTFHQQEYILTITDLKTEMVYETKGYGHYPIPEEVYLCISLSEPFEGYCYKLVAGILFLNASPHQLERI